MTHELTMSGAEMPPASLEAAVGSDELYSAKANGQTLSYEFSVKSHQLRGVSIKR